MANIGRRDLLVAGAGAGLTMMMMMTSSGGLALTRARTPLLSGPITGGRRGHAFGAAAIDLGAYDYVEEEYFIEGEARAYEPLGGTSLGPDGRWQLRPGRTAAYKTRILVMRPRQAAKFTGNVMLSWLNVSAGYEILVARDTQLRTGDAFVSISTQKVGLDGYPTREQYGLRAWDPDRYGTLNHPGDDFSYDILTQVARAVGPKHGGNGADPMKGLVVNRVIASGASQSAIRLTSYLNGVQPLEHALDGVVLMVSFGRAAPFDSTVKADPMGLSTRVRDDLGIPVMLVSTETEAISLFPVRQPDTERFRTWEVAGGAHAGGAGQASDIVKIFVRDGLPIPPGMGAPGGMPSGVMPNMLSYIPVSIAATHHMTRWVAGGKPPPSFPLITIAGDPPTIQRDGNDNALGGIRMPDLEVPVASYRGMLENGSMLDRLNGTTTVFPPEKIRQLYKNRADYLAKFRAATERGAELGYLLQSDVDEIVHAAAIKWGSLFTA